MSTEVRWRKGSTAEHNTFTGALAEVTVDTDKKTLVVHDGVTAGGSPLATQTALSERVLAVDSVADLSGLVGKYEGQQVSVKGYHAGSDVGGGIFYWDGSRTAENDGGTVFNGWVRENTGSVTVDMFGANSNNSDDTVAFQKAVNFIGASGGGKVFFHRNHRVLGTLNIPKMVHLQGPIDMPGEILPGPSADYQSRSGVLRVASMATLLIGDASGISQAIIIRDGLTLPFTSAENAAEGLGQFAGTAITANGADVTLHHLLILGFNKAFYSSNFERSRLSYVSGDCTNGIDIRVSYDIPYLFQCHFWPFTTAHYSWALTPVPPTYAQAGSLLTRAGRAYQFMSVGDWAKATNCFSYGYLNGFFVSSCNNVQLVNCGTDHFDGLVNSGAVGYTIDGTSKDTALLSCQAAAQTTAVVMNSPNNNIRVLGCNFWRNDYAALAVLAGSAMVTSTTFRSNGAAIIGEDGCIGMVVDGNSFDNESTPYATTPACLGRMNIGQNIFTNSPDTLGTRTIVNQGAGTMTAVTASPSASSGYSYIGATSRGTPAAPILSQSGDIPVRVQGRVYNGGAYSQVASLRCQAQGTVSGSSTPGAWVFSTTPSGATASVDRVAIYNTAMAPSGDNAYQLGTSDFRWSSVWAANGTIQTSDSRTKTDISDSALGLDFINQLRPVSYKFKLGGNTVLGQVYRDGNGDICAADAEGAIPAELITEQHKGTRTHWGLIAQEVKEVVNNSGVDFAGWVLTNKDDPNSPQALRYDQFISPLIKAVQELTERVHGLENRLIG
jgi:hypothetical protein